MGLLPFLCHRLASLLLLPILSYNGDVFSPTVHMERRLSSFWHKVQRWYTNCFACTPTDILAIKACLPPLKLLLAHKKHLAGLCILFSPPEINPVSASLPPSIQTQSLHHHAPDHRLLLIQTKGSLLLLKWLQPRSTSKHRAHLLIDTIAHSMLFLVGPNGEATLLVTSQHLLCKTYGIPPLGNHILNRRSSAVNSLLRNGKSMLLVPFVLLVPWLFLLQPCSHYHSSHWSFSLLWFPFHTTRKLLPVTHAMAIMVVMAAIMIVLILIQLYLVTWTVALGVLPSVTVVHVIWQMEQFMKREFDCRYVF